MNPTIILNTLIGTFPLIMLIVVYLLRVEHRLTKLETLILSSNGGR